MIIQEMPRSERPREKLTAQGRESLSNGELLAILLRTGTKEKTAIHLAEEILSMDPAGLTYLAGCTWEELAALDGIGPAKACQILAAVELGTRIASAPRADRPRVTGSRDVADRYMERMRHYRKEYFNVLLLSSKGDVIGEENVSVGDIRTSIVNPRESFTMAVRKSATAVVFIHNHPSGDPTPSAEDRAVTRRLCEAGEILGIPVLDHIIIGDGRYVSLKEMGLI